MTVTHPDRKRRAPLRPPAHANVPTFPPLSIAEFDRRYLALRPVLLAFARRRIDANDAEDRVQEVYLAARVGLAYYRDREGQPGLLRWLLGILNLTLRKHFREQFPEISVGLPNATECALLRESAGFLSLADLYDEIRRALPLAGLTKHETSAVRLRLDGYTLQEIALRCGRDVRTIHSRIRRGVARLQTGSLAALDRPDIDAYLFRGGQRVTVYRAPERTGAALAREKLRRLR